MSAAAAPDIGSALSWARARIAAGDARILLRHVLQCTAARLVAWPERVLAADDWKAYEALVERRAAGEPIAYLTGEREFFGRAFIVTPAVLIPRHETELLVELALARYAHTPGTRVLDLGTGSGVLAVSLALALRAADVTAVDRSREALLVAMANAVRLKASVSFVQGDWFEAVRGDRFHLIVANPPYVAAGDPHLDAGDVRFEPCTALASGPEGLDDLATIAAQAPRHLELGGWLFMEHGYNQGSRVRALLADAGLVSIATHLDLGGIERVTGGCWRGLGGGGAA